MRRRLMRVVLPTLAIAASCSKRSDPGVTIEARPDLVDASASATASSSALPVASASSGSNASAVPNHHWLPDDCLPLTRTPDPCEALQKLIESYKVQLETFRCNGAGGPYTKIVPGGFDFCRVGSWAEMGSFDIDCFQPVACAGGEGKLGAFTASLDRCFGSEWKKDAHGWWNRRELDDVDALTCRTSFYTVPRSDGVTQCWLSIGCAPGRYAAEGYPTAQPSP